MSMKKHGQKLGEDGIAMMMTLVTMLILSILAAELVYQNQVYTGIVFRARDQLRARLLVRSALRLGLLQLRATEKARGQIKSLGLGDESLADQIWQTPLILPPPALPGLTPVDTQSLAAFNKSLALEGTLTVSIQGEGDRLDLNQLIRTTASPTNPQGGQADSKYGGVLAKTQPGQNQPEDPEAVKAARDKIRKSYAEVLDQVFEKKRQDDENFRNKYPNIKADNLLLNLVAFMDPATKTDADNRNKADHYAEASPTPYSLKDAPLISESELSMVKGFDDTLANIVGQVFTTQPTSTLNVNKASGTVLQALIPELTNDNLERLLKRRDDTTEGGNFKSADEFWTYLNTFNNFDDAKKRIAESGIQILGKETSYRVIVTGESGVSHKTWLASVGVMAPLSAADKLEAQQQNQQATFTQAPDPAQKTAAEGEKPEAKNSSDSLRIIYLKAD